MTTPTERTNETILIDGQAITNTTFRDCTLIYAGGDLDMSDNDFTGCMWEFTGAAANTVMFLRMLAGQDGGRELVMDAVGLTERPVMSTDDLQDLFNR